jgi:ATP-binding cassette subfamily B (MDR/TAP) protein 10
VRFFAKEFEEIEKYNRKMDVVLHKSIQEASIQAKFYGVTGFSGNMIILTVLYYGGSLVTTDIISVGNLTSFILYAAYVGIGLNGMSTFYAEVMKGIGASGRLWELVDKEPAVPLVGGLVPAVQSRGDIRFNNVSFSYPTRSDVPVIKDLTLHIPQDSKVAVVGSSGSGKSTLGSLLLRLYEPDQGQIFLDDVDINSIDPSWLRTHVGTVSQEPILFSTSIRDNIVYGANDPTKVTDDQVEWAAQQANAHAFITLFPSGYSTLVGERGVMLSGGQKQRVAIARAILKNPSILLLDEATSALDAQSEYEVKEALERLMHNRTVIIIAHRLSTIRHADKIAVLDKGEIAEFGTFDELIKINDGLFKTLVDRQTLLDS